VAAMRRPCGRGPDELLLLLLTEATGEALQEDGEELDDDDDEVEGAGLSSPADEYPLDVVESAGDGCGCGTRMVSGARFS